MSNANFWWQQGLNHDQGVKIVGGMSALHHLVCLILKRDPYKFSRYDWIPLNAPWTQDLDFDTMPLVALSEKPEVGRGRVSAAFLESYSSPIFNSVGQIMRNSPRYVLRCEIWWSKHFANCWWSTYFRREWEYIPSFQPFCSPISMNYLYHSLPI